MLRIIFVSSVLLHAFVSSYYTFYGPLHSPVYQAYKPTYIAQSPPKTYKSKISYSPPLPVKTSPVFRTSSILGSPSSVSSNSIAAITRQQAEALKTTLRQLEVNPVSSKYIKKIFSAGSCIKSLDEAINAIEAGTSLIENASPELKTLSSSLNSITSSSDISAATRVTAKVLLQLESLLPKLTPKYTTCGSTAEASSQALLLVGRVLADISRDTSIFLSQQTRQRLASSQAIVNSVNAFLIELRGTFSDLSILCTTDKSYNLRSLSSIASMLDQLADLFTTLGAGDKATTIRQNSIFTQKIAAAIEKSDITQFGSLDCNKPGDFKAVAEALTDIADLVDEVGIDTLKTQAGISGLF